MAGDFTVYFDGACPLCRAEIAFYQRQKGADAVDWRDVSAGGSTGPDLSCAAALKRFHVREPDGRLRSGGAAFAALWLRLPRFRWAGRIGATPPFSWLLALAYAVFLPLRPTLQQVYGRLAGSDDKGLKSPVEADPKGGVGR